MIKYNNSNINDWYFYTSDIVKVYRNNAVCYYKITVGGEQVPCFAVVNDISQYSDTEFEDVFNKADEKWYKLNNLNQYEEYGVYGSGRNITYYEGKLTVDDGYEYIYSGGSWNNVGEVSGGTIDTVWYDPAATNGEYNFGHYFGTNYKVIFTAYLNGSYGSNSSSFWEQTDHTPIEFMFYSNGFFYDMHDPTSTTSPDVYTGDYSYRIMKNNTLGSYENSQILNIILTYGTVRVELEDGTAIVTGSTNTGTKNWYNGLYQGSIRNANSNNKCHLSRIQVYNASNELVNDLKFVKNQGVTGSQEISLYDSVLNVTYNNANSNTPSYHIVSSGSSEYPIYYDEKANPPNNLTFSSMTEAEEYECPWVGMNATIDGIKYIFSGDSQSGYEWVLYSRLPSAYTEVEYVESTGQSTVNLGIQLMATANVPYSIVLDNEMSYTSSYGDLQTFLTCCKEVASVYPGWYYRYNSSTNIVIGGSNGINLSTGRTLVSGSTYHVTITGNTNSNRTHDWPLNLFSSLDSNKLPWRFCKGKLYNMQVTYNNTLVRDLVPCYRKSDNVAGLYDLVNDVFYSSASGYDQLVAGPSV